MSEPPTDQKVFGSIVIGLMVIAILVVSGYGAYQIFLVLLEEVTNVVRGTQ